MAKPQCNFLQATYRIENGFLGGPYTTKLTYGDMYICVEQGGIRKITVSTDKDTSANCFFEVLQSLEKLLMLFDGCFIPLFSIELYNSTKTADANLESQKAYFCNHRLEYYKSARFPDSNTRLLEFSNVLTSSLFSRWQEILNELDVVHQLYLYEYCCTSHTVDMRCAFLIELAEPLVEIVKTKTKLLSDLNPGSRSTTLKLCLKELINKYGDEIFSLELYDVSNFGELLDHMVNSRNRIMHIKRNVNKAFNSSEKYLLYMEKMSFLYRRIIIDLLGVDFAIYRNVLIKNVECWDKQFGI